VTPDRVVVLNLERRPDRLAAFVESIPHDWPYRMPRPAVAIDGSAVDIPPTWLASPGAYGCAQTHLRELKSALHDGVRTLLVLEDDAVFVPDFTIKLTRVLEEISDDADILMLGGQHIAAPMPYARHVVQCVEAQRTHAYVINRRALRPTISMWTFANTHIDHSAKQLQALLKVYGPATWLVGQAAGRSDVMRADEPERYWRDAGRPSVDTIE
jgi:hypothetical protein